MELRQLWHFLAIFEAGSIAQAAQRVGLTQQALSKSLERLEAQCGAPLFERTGRGVLPTPFARSLIDHARAVTAEAGRLQQAAKTALSMAGGRVIVGLSPIAACTAVGHHVSAYAAAHPNLRIDVEAGIDRQFSRALIAGEIDLAVAAATEPEDPAVVATLLWHEPWCIAVSRTHPNAVGAKSLHDLAGARWLLGRNIEPLMDVIAHTFQVHGLPPPVPSVETTSVFFALNAIADGPWCSILPVALVRADARLMPLSIAQVQWQTPLVLMQRRAARANPAIAHLASRLLQSAHRQSRSFDL